MSTDAEVWLQSCYPELFEDWRSAYLKPANSGQADQQTTECRICQIRPNTGHHYGVKTCEADKQFLKRTFHERQTYKVCTLQCPPRFRGWCQYCRLRSSLLTGINLKMIRIGDRSKKEPRSKSPKQKSKKRLQIKVEPAAPKTESDAATDKDNNVSFDSWPPASSVDVVTNPNEDEPVHGGHPHDLPPTADWDILAEHQRAQLAKSQELQWPDVLYNNPYRRGLEHEYKAPPAPSDMIVYQPLAVYQRPFMYNYWPHYPPYSIQDWSQNSGYAAPEHKPDISQPLLGPPPPELFERARTPSQDLPLDLSSSSSCSSSSRPSSRLSSSDSLHGRVSPSSSFLTTDIGSSFNKLSVNSAVLQDALNMVDGSLSPARLANISNLSEVLSN